MADFLFITTFYIDVSLVRTGDFESIRNVFYQFIGQANSQFQLFARNLTDVTDALTPPENQRSECVEP